MNNISYKLLNKLNGKANNIELINEGDLELLYQQYIQDKNYIENQLKVEIELGISQQDFFKMFYMIYDILKFYISKQEFIHLSNYYLLMLMMDYINGKKVDLYWCIYHIYYLSSAGRFLTKYDHYEDCLPFLQQQLIKQFAIKEKITDKMKRKSFTKAIIKRLQRLS